MTSKIDYDEVLFEIKDGTEYATLHADAFRAAMRERDMLRAEREVWANIAEQMEVVITAARNLDTHRDEGYATLVSYLIRLHDALVAYEANKTPLPTTFTAT